MTAGIRAFSGQFLLAAVLALAACQAQPPGAASNLPPTPMNGVGYMLFAAPISVSSRNLFIADVTKFVDAGATTINLALNSPGGDIDAAQAMVDFMNRLHSERAVHFDITNVGLVASAASYFYLYGDHRYSAPNGVFLFHAATVTASGPMPAERLHEAADKLDAYERVVRRTLTSHSHLSDAEAQTYVRRTVLLNADDARRDGIVEAIRPFQPPPGSRLWVIGVRPAPRPAPPPQQPN